MSTTISESNLDTSELDAMEQEAKSAISKLELEIAALEEQNKTLLQYIASASVNDEIGRAHV